MNPDDIEYELDEDEPSRDHDQAPSAGGRYSRDPDTGVLTPIPTNSKE